ncbi:Oxoglutarate/iron-dependent dioxygenase [Penicillium brevicompactum]|uniref:Oxoglutarate/iron-dependent dioxygenase n=1 Tax=Penicillium brevicompactum TaxID=5074 RepID=UPI0025404AE7|nr:Oxoglutarate/iron-dependent dioxygenase [Penicillium brevicompactum]KAJ5333219.1 Oxoglutarate/iron-dependent dioxygenase [Penicillium brevicompactum]
MSTMSTLPTATAKSHIPVVRVAQELITACKEVGFVYIVNHSLPESMLDEAFHWSRLFFDLPQKLKLKAPHPDGWAVHRGYLWPRLEKVSQAMSGDGLDREQLREIPDFKESYDIGSDENVDQPDQWLPEEDLPGFRDFMHRFYWQCFRVGGEILRTLAVGLDLDENHLLTRHSGHNNQLRLLHYPPIPAVAIETDRAARCPAHTDWSSITMLFQDDCGGLEVEDVTQPGTLVPAPPLRNAIVMNVGDLLQRWSNDILMSTSHRVTLPPLPDRFEGSERMTRRRFSIPYFMSPDPDTLIECIASCVAEGEMAKYEPITQGNYNKMRASTNY